MNENIKYYLYARKSSESEERQVQSIEAQIDRLEERAKELGLNIVKVLTESASAKAPGTRPVFKSLLDDLEAGKANGIICWTINRLARNPKDAGDIQWMLQNGTIERIETIERTYLPDDNALLLSVETGMANQYIRDLSRDVKRGIRKKLENGEKPGMAPIGYMNKLDDRTIVPDPERFDAVKKMWELALSGKYNRGELYRLINGEWGFTTRKTGRTGGKAMASGTLYRLFTNKFYAGVIQYGGQEWSGKHKPMITMTEYELVQRLFNVTGSKRPKHREFAYTGIIRCADCGCMYTAETKTKHLKNGTTAEYSYYHCTRRKRDVDCPKQKWISEQKLERMIDDELNKITILPIFREWAMDILHNSNEERITSAHTIAKTQQKRLSDISTEMDNLTRMRYREQIENKFFETERLALTQERDKITLQISELNENQDKWLNATETGFEFATHAREKFNSGDLVTKRDIFRSLGQNFYIKDGKLVIEKHKWLEVIEEKYPELEREYKKLEPQIISTGSNKTYLLGNLFSHWLGW